jgi:hypothetical protein
VKWTLSLYLSEVRHLPGSPATSRMDLGPCGIRSFPSLFFPPSHLPKLFLLLFLTHRSIFDPAQFIW